MSKHAKLKARLLAKPKDFTWSELTALLNALGFHLFNGEGPRRKFFHQESGTLIILHEPHPSKILKPYLIEQVVAKLDSLEGKNE